MQSYKQGRARNGPQAKRSLGQNFLQDANIARKIVACLGITPDDSVLEIGPGQGALTGFIQKKSPARFVLVEKDGHWAVERKRQGPDGLCVLLADALTLPWERFQGSWKIIGNLPYNVASPLMWDICSRTPGLQRAVFMVQKEVGQRVIAQPGSSAYGALSVWIQSFMLPKLEFLVPPQVFRPRPKVDSAVLSFTPLPVRPETFTRDGLNVVLKACFQMRRKQLGSIARVYGHSPDDLRGLGVDPVQRPEELPPEVFHRLARHGFFREALTRL